MGSLTRSWRLSVQASVVEGCRLPVRMRNTEDWRNENTYTSMLFVCYSVIHPKKYFPFYHSPC